MADANLLVEIGLTERQYQQALARIEAQTRKSAAAAENSFKAVNKGAVAAGAGASALANGGLRNVSLQLSQVAQQGAATGNYLQALAIQLPDMAVGLGTVGIAAGVVAGALLPVVSNMIGLGKESTTSKEALKSYEEALKSLQGALDISGMSLDALTAKFGTNAGAARDAALILAQVAAAGSERVASESLTVVQAQLAGMASQIDAAKELEMAWRRAIEQQAQGVATSEQVQVAYEAYLVTIDEIESATGRTLDENLRLASALETMRREMEAGTISGEFRAAAEEALAIASATESMDEALQKALEAAIKHELTEAEVAKLMDIIAVRTGDIASNVGAAANEAARFAANFATALAAESALSDATAGGPDQARRDVMSGKAQREFFERNALAESIKPVKVATTRRGGGGGRSGGGGLSAEMREAQSLFEATRTEAEKYATELARIEELHTGGFITDETYARGLDMIAEKYGVAGQAAEGFGAITDTLKDAILDFAMGGEQAMDRLAESIKRAALEALLFGEGPLGGIFGGIGGKGILGGLFSSFTGGLPSRAGGGYTWDGPRAGGLDGKGGQLALLHPNETVIDHARGQGMGASITYAPVIDARGADQAAVARLASVVAEDRRMFADNVQRVMRNTGIRGR